MIYYVKVKVKGEMMVEIEADSFNDAEDKAISQVGICDSNGMNYIDVNVCSIEKI